MLTRGDMGGVESFTEERLLDEFALGRVETATGRTDPSAETSARVHYQEQALEALRLSPRYAAWLFDRCRPYLGKRVLDIGAGIGTFSTLAAQHADEVVAVEPEARFASLLSERFAEERCVKVARLEAGRLGPGTLGLPFDSIMCLNVLEHIEDDLDALVRLGAQLKPSGHLLLLVPAHPSLYGPLDEGIGHFRRYTKRKLGEKLSSAGFATTELRYVNPVGWAAWLFYARLLRRKALSTGGARGFDAIVPIVRPLDVLRLPFGLSLWAVARPRL